MRAEDDSKDCKGTCPFCGSTGDCSHLLLVVDKTFRMAEGGTLMHAFNARWSAFLEEADDDFDEREAFEELLDEVDSLSDAMTEHDQEGGPGMSSTYAGYFAKSQARAKDAMASFAKPGK
jgi:hypothetical protein